jgi:hypothetical protein
LRAARPAFTEERAARNPGIVPPQAAAHGRTYGELQAAWWNWILETPAPDSAALDPTGAKCGSHQTDHVWFLVGSLFGGAVNRTCAVPPGTFLFFPVANGIYGAFVTEPDDMRTEAFVRARTECVVGADIHAEIDGVPVADLEQFLGQSSLFVSHLATDNVFQLTPAEIPDLTLDPAADRGYYLYLEPLSPGRHTIHFSAAPSSPTNCVLADDVTYTLDVGP